MFGKKASATLPDNNPNPQPDTPATPQPDSNAASTPAPNQNATDASPQLPAVVENETTDLQQVVGQDVAQTKQNEQLVEANQPKSFAGLAQQAEPKGTENYTDKNLETDAFLQAKKELFTKILDQVDFVSLGRLPFDKQRQQIYDLSEKLIAASQHPLNAKQIETLKLHMIDEIFGFGPIEPLLNDSDVSDIMINGPHKIFIEKQGKIKVTDIRFADDDHLRTIIQRIVSRVGRRVDESSPMVDARMPDGSRFNAIIPPIAIDGSLVSIRKFKKNKMPLSAYVEYDSMSPDMAKFLGLCAYIGLNIIVSGGTGSGKTTMLNALSGCIDDGERIITIEDAAELQLQQPHVLRLETRPATVEGRREITQRQLVKNALRMRPDRIILGEIRGDEVIDVLAAMNTGHDGSMATIHANNPRDCLSRIENLVGMSGVKIENKSLKQQIASAVQLIVQVERMRDGIRRVTSIEEIVGIQGDMITMQQLFSFKPGRIDEHGKIQGEFICHGIRPAMISVAEYHGKRQEVLECFNMAM